jgi:hypothetical protein
MSTDAQIREHLIDLELKFGTFESKRSSAIAGICRVGDLNEQTLNDTSLSIEKLNERLSLGLNQHRDSMLNELMSKRAVQLNEINIFGRQQAQSSKSELDERIKRSLLMLEKIIGSVHFFLKDLFKFSKPLDLEKVIRYDHLMPVWGICFARNSSQN